MGVIDEVLRGTSDTKARRPWPGVTEQAAELFGKLFPSATKAPAIVVETCGRVEK